MAPPLIGLVMSDAEVAWHAGLAWEQLDAFTHPRHRLAHDGVVAATVAVSGLLLTLAFEVPLLPLTVAIAVPIGIAAVAVGLEGRGGLACFLALVAIVLVLTGADAVVRAGAGTTIGPLAVGLGLGGLVLASARALRELRRRRRGGVRLARLRAEVSGFNLAVERAALQADLASLGVARPPSPSVGELLQSTRARLQQALAVDRLLRERGHLLEPGRAREIVCLPEALRTGADASEVAGAIEQELEAAAEAREELGRELGVGDGLG